MKLKVGRKNICEFHWNFTMFRIVWRKLFTFALPIEKNVFIWLKTNWHWKWRKLIVFICISVFQLFLFLLFCVYKNVNTFIVPGVAPNAYEKGQSINIKAVKMLSTRTQLPYEYYSLQFCLPKNGTVVYKSENLGEVLRGDRIVNTPYDVKMAENINCKLLCNKKDQPLNWNHEQSSKVVERIQHEYYIIL